MKEWFKWTGLVLLATIVGLGFAIVFTANSQVQLPVAVAQSTAIPNAQSWDYGWMANIPGWMGPDMGGMMRSYGDWTYLGSSTPLTLDQAIEAGNLYLAAYDNPDLTLTEVMEFTENFYAEVEEESSGIHAFELLINRYSGAVYPEPGPNMMWNTRYGHMGGMLGWGSWQAGSTSVTAEKAVSLAQEWLHQYQPGTSAAEKADAFYGYYTIHVLKDGKVYGMLSVNSYTGEVWYHTWHGNFVGMKELEK
jgi:hypothetical protein